MTLGEVSEPELLEAGRAHAIALLERNLTEHGILAATPGPRADARGYSAIFARDAAVCSIGMALSGRPALQSAAATGLATIAGRQAPNGQMPKFVDVRLDEADFWYLGCIDATLWWLIGIAWLDALPPHGGLRRRFAREVARAINWLSCQEHQRFYLLQQNEASDWADIMPRSGFVLYTNALWYLVKQLYELPHAAETRRSADELFHPFGGVITEYRRARLLTHFVRRRARNRGLYLSFVNFAQFGDEGDSFGNILAVLCGLADGAARRRTLRSLQRAGIAERYPVRAVCEPIPEDSLLWRPYMSRHRQNYAWQYHNGGIWPFVGGFWVAALAESGLREQARQELIKLARANALGDWAFYEWLHGCTFAPSGMKGQSWNAATFILAQHALASSAPLFSTAPSAARRLKRAGRDATAAGRRSGSA